MKINYFGVLAFIFLISYQKGVQANPLLFWQKSEATMNASQLQNIKPNQQLVISGVNQSNQNHILVIRVDDQPSPHYENRVNLERSVPPGAFTFRINMGGLYTSNQRLINLKTLQQIKVFQGDGKANLELHPIKFQSAIPFNPTTIAWDFGPEHSAVFNGFKRIGVKSPYVKGPSLSEVFRDKRSQAYDVLTNDGIKGVNQIHIPLSKGRWYITLWIKEPGEWEFLPHPLFKKILANNKVIYQKEWTVKDWVEQEYLSKESIEASPGSTPWELYGKAKDGRISFPVDVSTQGLTIQFNGEQPNGSFISALLAEPTSNFSEQLKVETQRQEWWNETWRVSPWPKLNTDNLNDLNFNKTTTAGSVVNYWINLDKNTSDKGFFYQISDFTDEAIKIKPSLRYAQWRLERQNLSSTLLTPSNSYLKPSQNQFVPPTKADYRQLHIQLVLPDRIKKTQLKSVLTIQSNGVEKNIELTVNILPINLPEPAIPIGVYLEKPVHLNWFKSLHSEQDKALVCDLNILNSLGFSGVAPPFVTPKDKNTVNQLLIEYDLVHQAGFSKRQLAYAPVKRLQQAKGLEGTATQIQAVDHLIKQLDYPAIIWSIADEPSNAGEHQSPKVIANHLRTSSPKTLLAGHLNTPNDYKLLDIFDVVLINNGYGADKSHIEKIMQKNIEPWFYNLGAKRIFSGFYLWKTGARGFMQWHARMPTADPFNPTDGREGDAQFLYPTVETCPLIMPIDKSLIDLSEGIFDYRLMQLVATLAYTEPKLKDLLTTIESEIPSHFEEAQNIDTQTMDAWRQSLIKALTRDPVTPNSD